ncbi:MAG TPA: hypothetical protein VGM29_10335 [Polyangiaceae bacterium]
MRRLSQVATHSSLVEGLAPAQGTASSTAHSCSQMSSPPLLHALVVNATTTSGSKRAPARRKPLNFGKIIVFP